MAFQPEQHTGILIKKAARLFEQAANKNLGDLKVTHAQTIFLVRLMGRDGQSQMELAKSAGLKQPTVVRILDRMERDGLIKRVQNAEDRRVYNFYLTAEAKKACKKLEGQAYTMQEITTKYLPQNDVEKFNKLIAQMINNLEDFLANKK